MYYQPEVDEFHTKDSKGSSKCPGILMVKDKLDEIFKLKVCKPPLDPAPDLGFVSPKIIKIKQ